MPQKLTLEDARLSLTAHVAAKGVEIHRKHGPQLGWSELLRVLEDRDCVRYPVEVVFNVSTLYPGELAHPSPKGDTPEEGFIMAVHPFFSAHPAMATFIVLYQLVLVNYGEFASPDDAETFGAAALGLSRDEYYASLCAFADMIAAPDGAPAPPVKDDGRSCGCGGNHACGGGK